MPFITISDAIYPARLKNIETPPKGIFIEGNLECLSKPCIAIIGTRKPTLFAQNLTEKWAKILSNAGIVVISGFALGIDAAAHRGALQGDAKTIAVLGCGLQVDYPKQHQTLKQSILNQGGCIISEYPPNAPPNPRNFPHRNRIISGLSDGLLVIEAAMKSGSLITARIAVEQGKEVMAVPGNIQNSMTKGCHWLIRQGATLVSSIEEVAECLKQTVTTVAPAKAGAQSFPKPSRDDASTSILTKMERTILDHIQEYHTSIDEIVINSRLAFHDVCSILINLEISGYLEKVTGGYIRTGREP